MVSRILLCVCVASCIAGALCGTMGESSACYEEGKEQADWDASCMGTMVCAANFCSAPSGSGQDHCCAMPCTADTACSSSLGDKTCTSGYCKIGTTGSLKVASSSTTLLASVSALVAATLAVSLVMLH
ncbi:hypothetical protein T484DRAFT_1744509 [Baffinella frigidus]|nr:hypothetical protein T484DRAFT_1744509 [Cryptophyta sp. CCMP2293]